MREFLDDNFLLQTMTAERLYHEVAAKQPIIDYHNHLPPADIAGDRQFGNLFEAWLEGDHYKWRGMRTAGESERFCTGEASPKEKFDAWARTVPQTLGNPLYHWTHLELRRYFGIEALLSPATADSIWEKANRMLSEPGFSARGLLKKQNVSTVCTTDDPADNLEHHIAHQDAGSPDVKMFPAFRPDKVYNFSDIKAWKAYMVKLSDAAGGAISGWESLLEVLMVRHAYFHEYGCRVSDHGVAFVPGLDWTPDQIESIIRNALAGERPGKEEALIFQSAIMESCGRMDAAAGWTMQVHMGALRNVNPRAFRDMGPDTGFDVIGDYPQAEGLARFLGVLAEDEMLPKTILYVLNPADSALIATMIGAFQGDIPGKVQFGSGWWFNDQKDGMERQLTSLSSLGLLSKFVGMLTDSRSFLSFPRHEYFRRILCNMIGGQVERGEIPHDPALLDPMVEGICYKNAAVYFKLGAD